MRQTLFAALALAAMATGVWAHSKAEQTTPANDATMEKVEVIELRFDAPMRVTAITMTGPAGDVAVARETGMDPVTEFRAMPPADLPHGAYTVDWRGLSADGHPMQGTFGFTVAD
ncbi:copper resistance CopC family protein [uncultured Tateyamaria sp.]|uniref:copper resistance CopC family protein n=1 Tax=uncultured Tateyamaria sp. TaxID=455651 RepID=UPI002601AF9B|nr:copper resistance CopC family protein [uncultured Tateyamaria sp.]